VLLAFCLTSVLAFTEQDYRDTFTSWMQEHQKSYAAAEFQTRYGIFKSNMDYVHQWNNDTKQSKLALNYLADLSNAEYQRIYLGTKIDGTARLAAAALLPAHEKPVADTYNSTVDWRTQKLVTPIKNQGQCGSCWSFSTTGSTEGAHAQATGNLVSLSEQNLMDCSTSYGNQGCDGGLMDQAFEYIIKNKGIDTEASYPYKAADGTCAFKVANIGATISNYTDVKSGDEGALETAANIRPVSVAIDASHTSFQLYSSGVYHELFCSATKLDHGVLVVGYGTDTTSSKAYWIVKNSWGATWGQQGYIYMSKDKNNNCGIATSASYPSV